MVDAPIFFAWPYQARSKKPFDVSVSKQYGDLSVRHRTQRKVVFPVAWRSPFVQPGASALSTSFRSSLYQSTLLPIAAHTIHCWKLSGVVPKAMLRKGT